MLLSESTEQDLIRISALGWVKIAEKQKLMSKPLMQRRMASTARFWSVAQVILVCLCTLGASAFCRGPRALWIKKTRGKTLCRIGVNYWRRALLKGAAVRPPALITKRAAI